ncbi:glycosyltransferase [Hydrogenophaga sp. 5NK40-0174]|uniref:glycosyltransferase family 4 protein n=1 Tax=Hydrogenophaga sp. 5NK40-0174 TaxID=3127649 RepID=UPI003109AC90
MSSKHVTIVAPDIHLRDAVGNHCTYLARDLTKAGVPSRLFAERFSGDLMPVHPIDELLSNGAGDSTLLVSYSIIDQHLDALLAMPNRKICYFHGVTPPDLLREHEPVTADLCAHSYEQFPRLAGFDLLVCNSQLNLDELRKVFPSPSARVIPPVMPSFPVFQRQAVDRPALHDPIRLTVLGRVVPHKRLEDCIRIVAAARDIGLAVELQVIGGCGNMVYMGFLESEVDRLGVREMVKFSGLLSDEDLAEQLNRSDALLSCSEHEGFGVPILEAMHLGLPCLIRSGTAASGVGAEAILEFRSPQEAATQLQRLAQEPGLRQQLIKSGGLRAAQLLQEASVSSWLELLESV